MSSPFMFPISSRFSVSGPSRNVAAFTYVPSSVFNLCVCLCVCVCVNPVICKARHGISLLDTFQLFPSVAWSGEYFVPPTIYHVFLSSCTLPLAGNRHHVPEYIGSKNSLCFLYFPFRTLRGVATDSNYTGWNSKHSLFALKNLKSTT